MIRSSVPQRTVNWEEMHIDNAPTMQCATPTSAYFICSYAQI